MTLNTPCAPRAENEVRIDRYLDRVKHLPPAPTLMIKLLELFRKPEHDLDQIVQVMCQDLAITAELLRRCNRLYFNNQDPVTDVYEAVFRLGFNELHRMTMVLFGLHTMSTGDFAKGVESEPLWWHSLVTAICAGCLARELEETEGTAFTSGLLHDVGKVVLANQEGGKYLQLCEENGIVLCEAEQAAFGFTHAEIGGRLLSRWGVPATVVVPVFCHHQSAWSGPFARLSSIVCLANLLAHELEGSTASKPCELPEAVKALELLKLTPEKLAAMEPTLRSEIERLGPLFAFQG